MSGGRGRPSTIVDKDEGLGKVNSLIIRQCVCVCVCIGYEYVIIVFLSRFLYAFAYFHQNILEKHWFLAIYYYCKGLYM